MSPPDEYILSANICQLLNEHLQDVDDTLNKLCANTTHLHNRQRMPQAEGLANCYMMCETEGPVIRCQGGCTFWQLNITLCI